MANNPDAERVLRDFFNYGRGDGMTLEDLKEWNRDPGLRQRVLDFWKLGGCMPTTHYGRAIQIMSPYYLDFNVLYQYFGITFSQNSLINMSEVPYARSVLANSQSNHILVLGYPKFTIVDLEKRFPKFFAPARSHWYSKRDFANFETVRPGWSLIRSEVYVASCGKNFAEQNRFLRPNEERPRAVDVINLMVLWRLANRIGLYRDFSVWCRDSEPEGKVYVTYTKQGEIQIKYLEPAKFLPNLGLATMRVRN